MKEMIELHDSALVAVSWADGVAVVLLRPVRVHRSEGQPGKDAGTVWLQEVMFTITNASVSAQAKLPVPVGGGSLRIGTGEHLNLIPGSGVFAAEVTLELALGGTDYLKVTGDQLLITLTGEPAFLKEFAAG